MRAERDARRKELYEALHPEAALGANNQHTRARRQIGEEQFTRFTKATADATGRVIASGRSYADGVRRSLNK